MLNKNAIEKMLEMPDDKFIMMLNLVLGSAGIDMGSKKNRRQDREKDTRAP